MTQSSFSQLGSLSALCALLAVMPASAAEGDRPAAGDSPHWRMVVSPYSAHFRPSEEHKPVWAVGAERQSPDGSLFGGSFFNNSFGQPSAYVYLGQRYTELWRQPKLFWQWSAGVMYGYKGQYEDKVPLNNNGFSPGALLSLGWQFNRGMSAQVNTLGDAGLMFQLSYDLR